LLDMCFTGFEKADENSKYMDERWNKDKSFDESSWIGGDESDLSLSPRPSTA